MKKSCQFRRYCGNISWKCILITNKTKSKVPISKSFLLRLRLRNLFLLIFAAVGRTTDYLQVYILTLHRLSAFTTIARFVCGHRASMADDENFGFVSKKMLRLYSPKFVYFRPILSKFMEFRLSSDVSVQSLLHYRQIKCKLTHPNAISWKLQSFFFDRAKE